MGHTFYYFWRESIIFLGYSGLFQDFDMFAIFTSYPLSKSPLSAHIVMSSTNKVLWWPMKSSHPLRDVGAFGCEWMSTIQSLSLGRCRVWWFYLHISVLILLQGNSWVTLLVIHPILYGKQSCLLPLGLWGVGWLVLSNHVSLYLQR